MHIPVEFYTFFVYSYRNCVKKRTQRWVGPGWGVPRPFYKKSKLYAIRHVIVGGADGDDGDDV